METSPAALHEKRLALKLSHRDVAERTGLTERAVRELEQGRWDTSPAAVTAAARVAEVLDR